MHTYVNIQVQSIIRIQVDVYAHIHLANTLEMISSLNFERKSRHGELNVPSRTPPGRRGIEHQECSSNEQICLNDIMSGGFVEVAFRDKKIELKAAEMCTEIGFPILVGVVYYPASAAEIAVYPGGVVGFFHSPLA